MEPVTLRALYRALDEKIPSSLSCSWDNDGIMCAPSLDAEVHHVLCSLDVTEDVIDEAVMLGADCIVSHHPLIFRPLSAVTEESASGKYVLSLLEKKISVLSFHTRLDAVTGGVNDTLCSLLGLRVTGMFGTDGEALGRIAETESDMTFASFCTQVKNALHAPVLHCAYARKPVRRVAVLGGDGKDDWQAALAAGADTFLTGTMSYNTLLDAKAAGLNVAAAGHYYTEAPVADTLAGWIRELFPELKVSVSDGGCELLTI